MTHLCKLGPLTFYGDDQIYCTHIVFEEQGDGYWGDSKETTPVSSCFICGRTSSQKAQPESALIPNLPTPIANSLAILEDRLGSYPYCWCTTVDGPCDRHKAPLTDTGYSP